MAELPQNWIKTTFTQIFDIQGGTQPPKSSFIYEERENYIRLLQIRDFGNKPMPTYIPFKSNLKLCSHDDVLIARYGASIGRILTGMDGAYNVAIAKVIIPDSVEKRFVYYLLNSSMFQRPILSIERSAQDGFNKDDLSKIELKIPPLNEQKRIVEKLDKMIRIVDDVKSRLNKIPTALKRARQSILNQAITGELTKAWRKKNNKEFLSKTVKLSEVCELLNGYAYKSNTYVTDSNNMVIRLGNVKNNKILLDAKPVFIPNNIATETERFKIQENDILITLTGTRYKRDYLYSALVTSTDLAENNLYLNQRVGCFRVKEGCLPQYLNILLKTQNFLDVAFELETGNVNQGNIGTTNLKDIEIDIPDIKEQAEIVRRVKLAFEELDKIELKYQKAKEYSDKLTQSILNKAFRGELIPQDPNDKPVEIEV